MKIDLQRIDQTLERITQGQLDPLDAARSLLGMASEPPNAQVIRPPTSPLDRPLGLQRQSLDQLVRTLGVPPAEIEHDWRRQIQSLAHDWQQTHGVPLPSLELSDLWVDADNRLSLRSETLAADRLAAVSDSACAEAPTTPDTFPLDPISTPPSRQKPAVAAPPIGRRRMTIAVLALTACTVAAVYGSRYFLTASEPRSPAQIAERSQPATRSVTPTHPIPSAANSRQRHIAPPNAGTEPLQTLLPPDEPDADFAVDLLTTDNLPLSEVLPSFAAGADTTAETADTASPPETPQRGSAPSAATATDAMADADTSPPLLAPDPSPQPPAVFEMPVRFQFTEPQVSASWPLAAPAGFTADEWMVEVDVPESVQMTWIEPLAAQNLRRSTGLLQWAPAGAEAPLIGCRIELRVATNLSLKLRYAAQLDPSLPWQTFSPEQLNTAVDRAATTLQRLLAQQSELARQYTAASSSGRRLLKPNKEAVDYNVERLQTLSQRLQQLIDLQAALAQEAQLQIKLTTQRPERKSVPLSGP